MRTPTDHWLGNYYRNTREGGRTEGVGEGEESERELGRWGEEWMDGWMAQGALQGRGGKKTSAGYIFVCTCCAPDPPSQ